MSWQYRSQVDAASNQTGCSLSLTRNAPPFTVLRQIDTRIEPNRSPYFPVANNSRIFGPHTFIMFNLSASCILVFSLVRRVYFNNWLTDVLCKLFSRTHPSSSRTRPRRWIEAKNIFPVGVSPWRSHLSFNTFQETRSSPAGRALITARSHPSAETPAWKLSPENWIRIDAAPNWIRPRRLFIFARVLGRVYIAAILENFLRRVSHITLRYSRGSSCSVYTIGRTNANSVSYVRNEVTLVLPSTWTDLLKFLYRNYNHVLINTKRNTLEGPILPTEKLHL